MNDFVSYWVYIIPNNWFSITVVVDRIVTTYYSLPLITCVGTTHWFEINSSRNHVVIYREYIETITVWKLKRVKHAFDKITILSFWIDLRSCTRACISNRTIRGWKIRVAHSVEKKSNTDCRPHRFIVY